MTHRVCITCMRGEQHFDGCSHIDCPVRVTITAQPVGDGFHTFARGVENRVTAAGGLRRDPRIKEQE